MEKPPHREEYENLLAKQGEERASLRNEAHEEALAMDQEISEHKGTPEVQVEKRASQEKLKYKVIELPEMAGKPLSEVYKYLKDTYGEEKLARIPDDLNTLPDELKSNDDCLFFGSTTSRYRDALGELHVPYARWGREQWGSGVILMSLGLDSSTRVALLED